MRRRDALAAIAVAPLAAAAACSHGISRSLPPGSSSSRTAFGSQIYASDDVPRTIGMLTSCGATLVRVGASRTDFAYFDALFSAAASHGMRVIVISEYAPQPVDVPSYAANAALFQRRYAAYNPTWEIWNEPNLAAYWGKPPDLAAYASLAVATASALRDAGAQDVLSGGTSGIDIGWIAGLRLRGVFDGPGGCNGCAVHNYVNALDALNLYLQAQSVMPAGVRVHTTEACVVDAGGPSAFLQGMWRVHRYLGLPTLLWCEFRDGTAGPYPPYTDPMGLVRADYTPKLAYFTAQSIVGAG